MFRIFRKFYDPYTPLTWLNPGEDYAFVNCQNRILFWRESLSHIKSKKHSRSRYSVLNSVGKRDNVVYDEHSFHAGIFGVENVENIHEFKNIIIDWAALEGDLRKTQCRVLALSFLRARFSLHTIIFTTNRRTLYNTEWFMIRLD